VAADAVAATSRGRQKGEDKGRLRGLNRGGRLLVALVVGGAVFGIANAVQAAFPTTE
jgi:hypothetical protein